MKKFFADFKKFITRGNILDLAVGVVVGNAFSKIVTSLVNDIIMPLITWALGASSLQALSLPLKWEWVTDELGNTVKNVTLSWNYGVFLQTILDFLLIAFMVFLVLRILMNAQNALDGIIKEAKHELPFKERRALRKQGLSYKEIDKKEDEIRAQRRAKEQAEKQAQEEANRNKPTTESLLTEIRDLLSEKDK